MFIYSSLGGHMIKEKSCGAIVYYTHNKEILYLILKHKAGHWAFPKGHVENNETEVETALREIKEETSLIVTIDDGFKVINEYQPTRYSIKEVVYFMARSDTDKVFVQQAEIDNYRWCLYDEAIDLITYENDKKVLLKANDYLKIKIE